MGRVPHKEPKDYAGFFLLSTRNKIYTGKQVIEKNPTIQINIIHTLLFFHMYTLSHITILVQNQKHKK
jgi:hypothetical protein